MKKRIMPDGTVEIEGDPEEIVEYEEEISDDGKKRKRRDERIEKGRRLLNEETDR